jgi:hypothetical protein
MRGRRRLLLPGWDLATSRVLAALRQERGGGVGVWNKREGGERERDGRHRLRVHDCRCENEVRKKFPDFSKRSPAHTPESRRTHPTHAMHTHPFTLPIPPSLPTLVVGVLGGGAPNSLPPHPPSLTPHPKGGSHVTGVFIIYNTLYTVYRGPVYYTLYTQAAVHVEYCCIMHYTLWIGAHCIIQNNVFNT